MLCPVPVPVPDSVSQFVFDMFHCEDRSDELTPITWMDAENMIFSWRSLLGSDEIPQDMTPGNLAEAWNDALSRCRKTYFRK